MYFFVLKLYILGVEKRNIYKLIEAASVNKRLSLCALPHFVSLLCYNYNSYPHVSKSVWKINIHKVVQPICATVL